MYSVKRTLETNRAAFLAILNGDKVEGRNGERVTIEHGKLVDVSRLVAGMLLSLAGFPLEGGMVQAGHTGIGLPDWSEFRSTRRKQVQAAGELLANPQAIRDAEGNDAGWSLALSVLNGDVADKVVSAALVLRGPETETETETE